jgi:serine phosphatase RsbU (regulator of sigma subunit)/catechol 2,3-dioxygenase-like lactoylglutathione lyase family enzyme
MPKSPTDSDAKSTKTAEEVPNATERYLRLESATVFVRDPDLSLRFYVDKLGFREAFDAVLPSGARIIAVSPPNGDANLILVTPAPESREYALIGRAMQLAFMTEDIEATYTEWSSQGVQFVHPPEMQPWGGKVTQFEDPDKNSFGLIGIDALTRQIEQKRRANAEKLEAERNATRELDIARRVQAKLFPQMFPPMKTLEYAGQCIQARNVGGDYYDFLDLGEGKLGIVIADIAGKGIAGALLMANLQANLRSQSAIAINHPQQMLQLVNRLFYQNTGDHAYATLFFAEYDDQNRRLLYANCGHLSALVLRSDGQLQRLDSNCTVLGLFENWPCAMHECELFPGDTLLLYTDGVTEAVDDKEEEFGEERLAAALRRGNQMSPQELLTSIVESVREFSSGQFPDDLSLIVAKCR